MILKKDNILTNLMKKLVLLVNEIIPKDNNLWIFVSIPDYSDNSKALFEYLQKKYPDIKKTWLCYDRGYAKKLQKQKIQAYPHISFRGIWNFLRAKVIVTTHNDYLSLKSEKQIFVALWHGVPIKSIGFKDEIEMNSLNEDILKRIDILTVTSKFTKGMFSSIFHTPMDRIKITGLARNDKLYRTDKCKILLKNMNDIPINSTVILYAPTYRFSKKRNDPSGFPVKEILSRTSELESLLKRYNAYMMIKLHPLEEKEIYKEHIKNQYKHIKIIHNKQMQGKLIDLYDILPCVDILITDYSSVYIDFLLKNKPIVFFYPDLSTYEKVRGFLLEPYEKWISLLKSQDVFSLFRLLESILTGDVPKIITKNKVYQKNLKKVFHGIWNGESCERITKIILTKIKEGGSNVWD